LLLPLLPPLSPS
nr:Chain C, Insulin-like growth factor-binding protein-like 1 peptide [Homo sapiens]